MYFAHMFVVAAVAFFLTVVIEWPLLTLCSGLPFRQTAAFCFCLNGASWGTAMCVWAVQPMNVLILEGAIALAEAALLMWFWRWGSGRAAATSAAMNGASWLLGTPILILVLPAV
jgi:hypothetical protein